MTPQLLRAIGLRRIRRLRSAAVDWTLGELVRTLLGRLRQLREVGLAIPFLFSPALEPNADSTLGAPGPQDFAVQSHVAASSHRGDVLGTVLQRSCDVA